jgi:hypothetical protein
MSTDPEIQNNKTSKNRTAEIKPEKKPETIQLGGDERTRQDSRQFERAARDLTCSQLRFQLAEK